MSSLSDKLSAAAASASATAQMAVAGIRESLPHTEAELMNTDPAALQAREDRLRAHRCNDPRQPGIPKEKLSLSPQCEVKLDVAHPMLALEWHGRKNVKMAQRASPLITDANDVIVRITSTSICGSDTHMYVNEVPGVAVMKAGDIMGHECMGVIESVGPGVKERKVGDRVIVSAPISCGSCSYCHKGETSLCDTTNPSGQQEFLYGHRLAGILGYSHVLGGYSGGQAERVRVPFGDFNTLPVPGSLKDSQVLLLSDVVCTGFHGTELAEVKEGDVVVVWGAGPVGLAAAYLAKTLKKAGRVIIVDNLKYRLDFAAGLGLEPLNFDELQDGATVPHEIFRRVPGGPDRCIDCVGFRFPQSWTHKFMRATAMETDSPEIVRQMVTVTKKGGNIALIGDYFADCNRFPLGQLMEKAITLRGGQLYCQTYWKYLLDKIADGSIDLRPWITHQAALAQAPEAYRIFDEKADHMLKCQLVTDYGLSRPENDDVKVQKLDKKDAKK